MWANWQGQVFKAHADIRAAFATMSLPAVLDEASLLALGLQPVQAVPSPEVDHTQTLSEGPPVKINDQWQQTWITGSASAEEIAQRTQARQAQVRDERAALLKACDWTQLPDASVNAAAWAVYRQALRDVPQQPGFPWSVTWPSQP